MALLPKVKLKAMLNFPSNVIDGTGVDVTRVNGAFKLDLAYDDFAPPVIAIEDAPNQNVLLWNDVTNSYTLARSELVGGPTGPIGPEGPPGPTGGATDTEYATLAIAAASTIPVGVNYLRTAGYSVVGDMGGAFYKRVGSEPSHAGKFQSTDGAWWELTEKKVTVAHFGGTMVLASAAHVTATDQTTYANLAADYCRATGAIFHIPGGTKIRITTGLVDIIGVVMEGAGAQEETGGYGLNGSVILTDGPSSSAFLVGYGTFVRGIRFYDPGQLELNTTPLVRPALFLGAVGVGIDISHNFFTNTYNVLELGSTLAGRVKVYGNLGFFINNFVKVTNCADIVHVYDNVFSIGYFGEECLVGPTFAIRDYATANSNLVYAHNGSGGTAVDGLRIFDNFVFGISRVLDVASGSIQLCKIQGNLADGSQSLLRARGSGVFDITVDNNEIAGYKFGDRTTAAYIVDIDNSGNGYFVMRKNVIHVSDGDGIKVYGSLLEFVSICENDIRHWGSTTGADVARYAIIYSVSGLAHIKNNNLHVYAATAPTSIGIRQTSAAQGVITGNSVYGTGSDAFQLVAGGGNYDGNTAMGCTWDLRVTGGNVKLGSNLFDAAKYVRSGGSGALFPVLTP